MRDIQKRDIQLWLAGWMWFRWGGRKVQYPLGAQYVDRSVAEIGRGQPFRRPPKRLLGQPQWRQSERGAGEGYVQRFRGE